MSELFLTQDEVSTLTGKQRRPAQKRVLNAMGIDHRTRPDGALIISRSHIEHILNGHYTAPAKEPEFKLNWS